jgi:hypothetical protein
VDPNPRNPRANRRIDPCLIRGVVYWYRFRLSGATALAHIEKLEPPEVALGVKEGVRLERCVAGLRNRCDRDHSRETRGVDADLVRFGSESLVVGRVHHELEVP